MIYLLIFFLLSLFGLGISQIVVKSKITSPLTLHSGCWLLVSVVGLITHDAFIDFPESSAYALLIWFTIIYFILFVGEIITVNSNPKISFEKISSCYCGRYWLFVIPVSIISICEIYWAGSSGSASFLLNLRLANTIDDYSGYKPYIMLAAYPIIMSMFTIANVVKTNKFNYFSLWMWIVIFCIGTMGKFAVITPVLIFLVVKEMKDGFNKKKVVIYMPLILLLMLALHFSRMASGDTTSLSTVLGTYIYSPTLALSKLTELPYSNFGEYSLRFYYAIIYKLGLFEYEPVKTILDYVSVPSPTNVYTAMQPFYQDFSYAGVAIGAIIYGLFFSIIYGAAKQGSVISLLVYALMSVSLLTSFFAETLITNLSGNLKVIICVYILWRCTVKCKLKQ